MPSIITMAPAPSAFPLGRPRNSHSARTNPTALAKPPATPSTAASSASAVTLVKRGNAEAASKPSITTTMINSMRVKPDSFVCFLRNTAFIPYSPWGYYRFHVHSVQILNDNTDCYLFVKLSPAIGIHHFPHRQEDTQCHDGDNNTNKNEHDRLDSRG